MRNSNGKYKCIPCTLALSLARDANNTITCECKYQTRLNLCIMLCVCMWRRKNAITIIYRKWPITITHRSALAHSNRSPRFFQAIYSYIRLQIAQSHKLIIPSDWNSSSSSRSTNKQLVDGKWIANTPDSIATVSRIVIVNDFGRVSLRVKC